MVERVEGGALEARARGVTLPVGRAREDAFRSVELLLAALGSCMLGTLLTYAATAGLALDAVAVELVPTLAGSPERVSRIDATLRLDGDLPERRRAALLRAALQCKVHATLAHSPDLSVVVAAG